MSEKCNITQHSTGMFRDIITYKDGRKEIREGQNIIVKDITKLIACLFKRQSGYSGLSYWAIGTGASSWDTNPASATVSDTKLTSELVRKEIRQQDVVFIDSLGNPTETPTNKIRISVTFNTYEAVGSWREFGIFGGNATSTKDSGIMINHKIHGRIDKDNETTIERQIIFTFN